MENRISAEIIADSMTMHKKRATSFVLVFPRIILAELNTHRMLSRNSASSRAVPFEKMLKRVMEEPFVPIAWQKNHSGMQGKEYLDPNHKYDIGQFLDAAKELFQKVKLEASLVHRIKSILVGYGQSGMKFTLEEWWLVARDRVVEAAIIMSLFDTTKQLCNRLLEPFMYHTAIVTATELENFFHLRCPQYTFNGIGTSSTHRSKLDAIRTPNVASNDMSELDWMLTNKSGAEIHIQDLAEKMWDAYNNSIPKELKPNEWHIPFGDKVDFVRLGEATSDYYKNNPTEVVDEDKWLLKIATARCARVSYINYEGNDDYHADFELHDRLADMGHWSPFEHCARAMTDEEFDLCTITEPGTDRDGNAVLNPIVLGVSGNLQGFHQYRKTFKGENVTK